MFILIVNGRRLRLKLRLRLVRSARLAIGRFKGGVGHLCLVRVILLRGGPNVVCRHVDESIFPRTLLQRQAVLVLLLLLN